MPTVRVRDIEMAYDDAGRGPAVVLLHGFPFNRSMWAGQVEALAGDYRVITPDLRGMGETAPGDGPATMDEMAHDVAALMDKMGVERAVVGGLSMGGYVALAFYRRHRLRARALVLADTRPGADTDDARRTREEQAQKILGDGTGTIADDFLKKVLTPETLAERPEVVARVREMIAKTNARGAAQALRGMAVRHDQTSFLEDVIVPTLILVGSEDKLTPPKEAELMRREIRGSRMQVIEGASHLSNVERADEFSLALKTFLDELHP
ncbi:MAG TPA: alpha/beta fold hydrolase [Pyrinomonadaceae bacterium]|nr:alpha/beta fold hydrolase [Pyrinomonadaceae bacterium]